jgi:hypothetical protein
MLALTNALSASGLLSLMAAFCLCRWNKIRKEVRKREALDRFAHAARKEFDGYAS